MGSRVSAMVLIATLLVPAAGHVRAQQTAPIVNPTPPITPKRIFTPPPLQWDSAMTIVRPAIPQTPADFISLTGGIGFGMSPGDVNSHLPNPYPGLSWNGLPTANEYPGEVRYFGVPIDHAGPLRMDLTACPGGASYLVFLFNSRGLFRLSYRLTADKTCADTNDAAQAIFAPYVRIGQTVALSVRYRTGNTQVVDVTDPNAASLIPVRWRQAAN